jgi:DNA-binding transcriptional MerR regulator
MAERALTIGEVATRSGVSRRALRLYEARGIVPKPRRTQAGYRVYDAHALGILHFVTQARRLGLTLKEIGHIIDLRSAKPGPCVHVRALLEQKLIELDSLRREVKRISMAGMPPARSAESCASTSKEESCHGQNLTLPSLHGLSGSRHRRRYRPHWRGGQHRQSQ